jgi:hypothetical protein
MRIIFREIGLVGVNCRRTFVLHDECSECIETFFIQNKVSILYQQ